MKSSLPRVRASPGRPLPGEIDLPRPTGQTTKPASPISYDTNVILLGWPVWRDAPYCAGCQYDKDVRLLSA